MLEKIILLFFLVLDIVLAVLIVTAKDVRRAIILLMMFAVSISGTYFSFGARFLSAIQLIIYAGIVAFYFFVTTTTTIKNKPKDSVRYIFGLIFTGALFLTIVTTLDNLGKLTPYVSNIKEISESLFSKYTATFGIILILLLISTLGSLNIIRRKE
jgi:NADH-quinone oxidoreductase subunit J